MDNEATGRAPDAAETLPFGPAKGCPACGAIAIALTAKATRGPVSVIMSKAKASSEPLAAGEKQVEEEVFVGSAPESPLHAPLACWSSARVRVGWFRRCRIKGRHLHERCKCCGYEWITSFAGAI